jgi:hypothetical protein
MSHGIGIQTLSHQFFLTCKRVSKSPRKKNSISSSYTTLLRSTTSCMPAAASPCEDTQMGYALDVLTGVVHMRVRDKGSRGPRGEGTLGTPHHPVTKATVHACCQLSVCMYHSVNGRVVRERGERE